MFKSPSDTSFRQSSSSKNICLICYCTVDKYIVPPLPVFQKVINSCSKYLHSAITKDPLTGADKWDRAFQDGEVQLPFCQQCFQTSLEISQLHDQLEKFQKEIGDLTLTFSIKILGSRNHALSKNASTFTFTNNNGTEGEKTLEIDISGFNGQLLDLQNKSFHSDGNEIFQQMSAKRDDQFSWNANQNVESLEVNCDIPYAFNEPSPISIMDHFLTMKCDLNSHFDRIQQQTPQSLTPNTPTYQLQQQLQQQTQQYLFPHTPSIHPQQQTQLPSTSVPSSATLIPLNSTMHQIENASISIETPQVPVLRVKRKYRPRRKIIISPIGPIVENFSLKNPQVRLERLQFGKDGKVIIPEDNQTQIMNSDDPKGKDKECDLRVGQCESIMPEPEECTSIANTSNTCEKENELSNDENASHSDANEAKAKRRKRTGSVPGAVVQLNSSVVTVDENEVSGNDKKKRLKKKATLHGTTYKCRYCFQGFRYIQFLQYHEQKHLKDSPVKDKPFKCPQCNKGFAFQALLKQHLNAHDGRKPYVCDICGDAFSWKSGLYQHKLTHDNLRYQCKICTKVYKGWNIIRGHFKRDHPETKIAEDCVNVFKDAESTSPNSP